MPSRQNFKKLMVCLLCIQMLLIGTTFAENQLRTAKEWFDKGMIYTKQKEFGNAIEAYTKAIELNSKYKEAYLKRGQSHQELEQFDVALNDFDKAIKLDPTYVEAYISRGATYTQKRKFDLALNDFNKAIERDPKNSRAYAERAYGLWYDIVCWIATAPHAYVPGQEKDLRKQYDLAIADINKAIELGPNDDGDYYIIHAQIAERVTDADLIKAVEINPQESRTYLVRSIF